MVTKPVVYVELVDRWIVKLASLVALSVQRNTTESKKVPRTPVAVKALGAAGIVGILTVAVFE